MIALSLSLPWRQPVQEPDPQRAFRAGLDGRLEPLTADPSGLEDAGRPFVGGPCGGVMAELDRLPGLDHWRAAFEVGRAIRAIAQLLDQARAPASVGRQFRDNLVGAIMTHRMRKLRQPWGAEDTVAMFMEMYCRILGDDDRAADLVRQRILAYARQQVRSVRG